MVSFEQIVKILGATTLQVPNPENKITFLLTDSRRLASPGTTLFFGIDGPTRVADEFVLKMYENGVRNFILKPDFPVALLKELSDANILLFHDVVSALQLIAANHRKNFCYPVIGITGSNGKTIVKEWIFQLLHRQFQIVRSPKSYNSQIGVPLSVWQMNNNFNLAVFEAGISKKGEMQNLEKVISPELGILCYMGNAHAEGFANFREKIWEKLQLFVHSKALVYCEDDPAVFDEVARFKKEINPELELMGWSKTHPAFVTIRGVNSMWGRSVIHVKTSEEEIQFELPFTDSSSVYNAITAYTATLFFGVSESDIMKRLAELRPVEMRLELIAGINNCSIINDSYSSDFNSLEIAVDFLMQLQQHEDRTVILSDMLESGLAEEKLYTHISTLLSQKRLHRFIGIGTVLMKYRDLFTGIGEKYFYPDTSSFISALPQFQFRNESILLKGARVFQFEHISRLLQQKIHETVLEINLNAMRSNVKSYKALLHPGVRLMAMVKAFSYGSGSFEIANLLQHEGIDYLAVAYADEGVELRKSGIRLSIMVMNTEYESFESLVRYNLEPEIYSFRLLQQFNDFLELKGINEYPVHIKLDTGMHRLGFLPDEVPELCNWFKAADVRVRIISVFSHLASSGNPEHDDFTRIQFDGLMTMSEQLMNAVGYPFLRHISNSSAIHRHPEMQLDMVRLGIGMYGIDETLSLQNVTTLKSTISQVKLVKAGETVGYNRNAQLTRDSLIAVVRIGYADGYSRILGNGRGSMLIKGKKYPVIGNVCMDMLMLDVTGGDVSEDDEVIVFGEDLPVWDLAELAETIPYEMLTNISQRVKRLYYEE